MILGLSLGFCCQRECAYIISCYTGSGNSWGSSRRSGIAGSGGEHPSGGEPRVASPCGGGGCSGGSGLPGAGVPVGPLPSHRGGEPAARVPKPQVVMQPGCPGHGGTQPLAGFMVLSTLASPHSGQQSPLRSSSGQVRGDSFLLSHFFT